MAQAPEDNLYNILGCTPNSSAEQIHTEYKLRAKEIHPDKNEGFDAARFQHLQQAYDVLKDPSTRSGYDQWLNSGISISYEQWRRMKCTAANVHWVKNPTTSPMIKQGEGKEDKPLIDRKAIWSDSTSPVSEHLRKFRNYEI